MSLKLFDVLPCPTNEGWDSRTPWDVQSWSDSITAPVRTGQLRIFVPLCPTVPQQSELLKRMDYAEPR